MVHLEITLKDETLKFIEKDLQECIEKFFKEHEQLAKDITVVHTFEGNNPTNFMKIGGNQSCIDWLKWMQQGQPPINNNNKKGDNNE